MWDRHRAQVSAILARLRGAIPRRNSLQGRIVLSVGAALLLILCLFVVVALWVLRQGTEEAFKSRVTQAEAHAGRIDDAIRYVASALEANAAGLVIEPDGLTNQQLLAMISLRRRVGPSVSLFLLLPNGEVWWGDCAEPCTMATVSPPPLDLLQERAPLRALVSEAMDGAVSVARIDVPLTDPAGHVAGELVTEIDLRHPALLLFPDSDAERGDDVALITDDGRLVGGAKWLTARVPAAAAGSARAHARLIVGEGDRVASGYRAHPTVPGRLMSSHIVAFARLESIPSWVVTVEPLVDEALALPIRAQWLFAVFCGVTLGVVMGLAFFDVRRITAPIQQLTVAARRLAAGDLDEPVHTNAQAELGEFARTFEAMRVQIRALMDRERNVAVLEERERIAAEMHDGLGQVLGYVIMKTMAVDRLIENGDAAEARAQVDQLGAAARGAYADVRESILALRTTLSPGRDLLTALHEYLDGFGHQNGIVVGLDAPEPSACRWIDPAAEVQALRIVQEALTNVRKHAAATSVQVRCALEGAFLHIDVTDNGRGFDIAQLTQQGTDHFGLQIMRERAESVGGTFTIGLAAEGGTRISIALPRRGKGAAHVASTNPAG